MSTRGPRLVPMMAIAAALGWPAIGVAQDEPPAPVHEHVSVAAPQLTPTRETSGTAWLPAATPMYGIHGPWRGWDLRVSGAVTVQALYEPRARHRTGGFATGQATSLNWGMLTARRSLGGGRFGVRTMLSAEPWTVGSCGSLSLLATGEVCRDDTIHDRQQPHDLFMELAADYERPLAGAWRWQVYAGLAGEPAIGIPGYPHRLSAMTNPTAPITHHWFDSTHVTFGVFTVGVNNRRWKIEASAFNGRAPDESRVDLDLGGFDSVATRLSWLPTDRLALQVSGARLRDARTDFVFSDQEPITRLTASAVFHAPLAANGIWATTLAFGANRVHEVLAGDALRATTLAAMLESRATWSARHTLFGRAEIGELPAHHLHALEFGASVFVVGKVQVGYVRHLAAVKGIVPGIGGTVAISGVPPELRPHYSGRALPGVGVFFTLQPAEHQM